MEFGCETPNKTPTEKAKWTWEAVEAPGLSRVKGPSLHIPFSQLLCQRFWENSAP